MSRKSRMSLSAVEKLIEQRRLFQDWLAKLGDGVEGMPAHVVERVKNDYRARLDGVVGDLGEHGDSLREALDEAQLRHDGLDAQQQAKKDELAELRLRRHVGEMDDAAFKEQSAALKLGLEAIQKELGAALRDMERFEEILEVISAVETPPSDEDDEPVAQDEPEPAPPPAPVTAEPARAEPVKAEPVRAREPEPAKAPEAEPVRAEAPRSESARTETARDERRSAGSGRKAGVDELAFLRSVTTTVGAVKPAAAAKSTAREEPAPAPEPAESAESFNAAPNLLQLPASEHDEPAAEPAKTATKDEGAALTCGECGAKNRPTEWYCEKCGAELAAI